MLLTWAKNTICTAAIAALSLFAGGCVERTLTINTSPAGARVYLNDEEIGVSPVTVSFLWYGKYNIEISKDGYEILTETRDLKAPVHDTFPIDFFAEVLWPGKIRDQYSWNFTLKTLKTPTRQQLLKRAGSLRQQALFELK